MELVVLVTQPKDDAKARAEPKPAGRTGNPPVGLERQRQGVENRARHDTPPAHEEPGRTPSVHAG